MSIKMIRSDSLPDVPYGPESDSCAIYLSVRKQGQTTFGTLKRSIGALVSMGHRTGFVNGEGDGAGVQSDIPRRLWARKLSQAGLRATLASLPGFWVGHLFIPKGENNADLHNQIYSAFEEAELNPVYLQPGRSRKEVLGGNARLDPPDFWQIAGCAEVTNLERHLLKVQTSLESSLPVHFLSLSPHSVVYKVRGSVETLVRYYPDLQDLNYDTSVVLCHARYSTNTVSNFERAQPFALLGHNGEINTITRFRLEAEQIGAILPRNGSDSQDIDRTIHTLCANYDLDLIEAMETVFPPVPYELERFPPEQRAVYARIRQSFGPYAQGPAAILARLGDTIVASVDALGLRPLWFVETEKEYIFSSERGAIPLEVMVSDPRPLGPGEKMAICLRRGENARIFDQAGIREHVLNRAFQREAPQLARLYWTAWDQSGWGLSHARGRHAFSEILIPIAETPSKPPAPSGKELALPWNDPLKAGRFENNLLAANGWSQEHVQVIHDLVIEKKEVGSLGYDGPLASLAHQRVNIADFFKETVAVVTNPAIDHDREAEAFSTSSLLGASPGVGKAPDPNDILVSLKIPILTGGHPDLGSPEEMQALAEELGTYAIERLLEIFDGFTTWLPLGAGPSEGVRDSLARLASSAVQAVENGSQCIILDDSCVTRGEMGWLDPLLAVSCIDEALREAGKTSQQNLRRKTAIMVRSAAIRNLHDIVLLTGFGADAINCYALFGVAVQKAAEKNHSDPIHTQRQVLLSLKAGLEKAISTMGCHELRGYGRVCSSIGLAPSVAAVLKTPNFFGSEEKGLTWMRLDGESIQRGQEIRKKAGSRSLEHVDRFFPRLWKKVGLFTRSEAGYDEVSETFHELEKENPVALRHVIDFKKVRGTVIPSQVDLTLRDYRLPVVISAMSCGSQGETSFRAYAEASSQMNIICINGEGGELPEMMGRYKKNRAQQIASGRSGVKSHFLNSAAVLEIKIGQGAKPGEGGMLPGDKVSPQVAEARHTPPYVALLSPSNNHD
ncbi:MAG: glutamate synthase, partial [Chloroflexota bacterium]